MLELESGVRRVTFPLPLGIDHVHCYLLPASDGSWTAVDSVMQETRDERDDSMSAERAVHAEVRIASAIERCTRDFEAKLEALIDHLGAPAP